MRQETTLSFWRRWDQWLRPSSVSDFPEPTEEDELAAVLAEPPDFERRAAIRHPVSLETQCMLIALVKSDPWLVLIRDISTSGMGFVFPYPLPPGTFVMVELPRRSRRDVQRLVRAQVVSARELEDDSYLIGCALTEALDLDVVDAIVG